MVTLHYAPYAVGEKTSSIFESKHKDLSHLLDKIAVETSSNYIPVANVVYLCAYENQQYKQAHIIVDRNPEFVCHSLWFEGEGEGIRDVWLFTCASFEDAYEMALDMKESCDYDSEYTYERKNKL